MNTRLEGNPAIIDATWPACRVVDAMQALARHTGLAMTSVDGLEMPAELPVEQLNSWIETAADLGGLQAEQAYVALDEIELLLSRGAPALIRLAGAEGAPFIAVLGRRGRSVQTLGRDLRVHRLKARHLVEMIRHPFEASVEADIDRTVDRLDLTARARTRARKAMMADRLRTARFRGCWLIGLPPAASITESSRENRLRFRLTALVGAYVTQYALFVMSWWLLGRGVLNDTVDRGWLLGWLLLLASLIPVRLVATWNQGTVVVAAGVWLRRRLLRGASLVARQEVRRKGVGQLFGLVIEAAAIDALALSGGIVATFSLIELAIASLVLLAGATIVATPLLLAWTGIVGYLGVRYFKRRMAWTTDRFGLSEQLLECMLGHRTRLVQQPVEERHQQEDESLRQYIGIGDTMDRASVWLALVPRGWLLIALAVLTPAVARGAASSSIAVSIGGALLAYRALQRLVGGFSNLAGAVISARSVATLARAGKMRETAGVPSAIRPSPDDRSSREGFVAQLRDLTFRYRSHGEPVLNHCSLNIPRRARLLLEGPSGSGKTTLASMVAGLESPESGLLLIDGLDRGALGAAGWRSRVAMAPQAHDNYLVGASLAFNLLMGRRWPAEPSDLAEADRVCRELGLGDLLDRLPAGLDQVVGESGWRLSQGEKTRVFLARALLQRPELLVLDESFSALDSENVERAMRCVNQRARAVLAIAHL